MRSVIIAIERRPSTQGLGTLHSMEACPDRLTMAAGELDEIEVGPVELAQLKSRHPVCATCQHLDVASSADRVRYLLAGMAKRAS